MENKRESILDKISSYFFVKNYDYKDPYFTTYDKDSPNIQDYIKNRLEPRITWYDRQSRVNMNRYNSLQVSTLGISAIIPVINVVGGTDIDFAIRILSAFLGGLIAAITGILQLSKAHESWILYRSTAETLIREYNLFMLKVGDYSDDNTKEESRRNSIFIDICEAIMSTEENKYFSLRQHQQQQQQQQKPGTTSNA
jgi:Protein of unknown function (DUF4231)